LGGKVVYHYYRGRSLLSGKGGKKKEEGRRKREEGRRKKEEG
jgi:hypothetical protein